MFSNVTVSFTFVEYDLPFPQTLNVPDYTSPSVPLIVIFVSAV